MGIKWEDVFNWLENGYAFFFFHGAKLPLGRPVGFQKLRFDVSLKAF